MQTEFYTNLNKKVDVILFFIYWTKHVHVMLNNILGDDVGARPSHCTVGPVKGLCGFMTSTLVATRKTSQFARYCIPAAERGDDK